jgi:hypothetical protein
MTRLKARQERFCRRFVQYGCATTAAVAAGYAPEWAKSAGYRLIRHPRVAARIAEIEAEAARLHSPGDDVLIGKLETVYRRAIVDHQFHAAARAVHLQAKLRGRSGRIAAPAHADGKPAGRCAESPRAGTASGPSAAQNDDFCLRGNAC